MGLLVNITFVFVICSGISVEFAAGQLWVNQTAVVAMSGLAGEYPDPASEWPIWRSLQKGVAKRRPDVWYHTPLAPWVCIYSIQPKERGLTIALSSFSIWAVRRHQSLQVYRL